MPPNAKVGLPNSSSRRPLKPGANSARLKVLRVVRGRFSIALELRLPLTSVLLVVRMEASASTLTLCSMEATESVTSRLLVFDS